MKGNISTLCAKSLRTVAEEQYGCKIKSSHAQELVAAYFGYKSKNALLADSTFPVDNFNNAQIVILTPTEFIDQRRDKLRDLPPELPDSYTLGEAVYIPLFSDDWWSSPYAPFKSIEKAAIHLAKSDHMYDDLFKHYRDIPVFHSVDVFNETDHILVKVFHQHETTDRKMRCFGETKIKLPRVAGHIGFGEPIILVGLRTGQAAFKRDINELKLVEN